MNSPESVRGVNQLPPEKKKKKKSIFVNRIKEAFCLLISGTLSVALELLGWQACGQWQWTAVNELNQPLVNSTLCRHKRKEAKDSRDEGNPTVSWCGSAASRWSQKGSNNSHVHPRRAEDRHTSEGELEVEGVWIYPGVSERCSNCGPAPSCFSVINSANSGVTDCGDGSVYCLLSQRLVTVKLGLPNTVLQNFKLNNDLTLFWDVYIVKSLMHSNA